MPAANEEIFRLALSMQPSFLAVSDDLSALYSGLLKTFQTFEALRQVNSAASVELRAASSS